MNIQEKKLKPDRAKKSFSNLRMVFEKRSKLTFKILLYDFRRLLQNPTKDLEKAEHFRRSTRYRTLSRALWCCLFIALMHPIYVLIVQPTSHVAHMPKIEYADFFDSLFPTIISLVAGHFIQVVLLILLLCTWLFIHYSNKKQSQTVAIIFSLLFILITNAEGLIGSKISFADIWLIFVPILIIPALGNRMSVPIILINIAIHLLISNLYEANLECVLFLIASFFVSIYIILIQLEYYRREFRIFKSNLRLRERIFEIQLIKDNINNGLMLLDLDLNILSNYNDMCSKLLHKSNLHRQNFTELLGSILEENSHFRSMIDCFEDSEGEENTIKDPKEWQDRINHYFEMLKAGNMNEAELAMIDPLRNIKLYSYEGRSYLSFHVSALAEQGKIKYFMVIISDETGKLAGRYRLREYEVKQTQRAEILLSLLENSPLEQITHFEQFARHYLALCNDILTELRSTLPPKQFVETVITKLNELQSVLYQLNLQDYSDKTRMLTAKCEGFTEVKFGRNRQATIIDKPMQTKFIQLILDCERFLYDLRPLVSISVLYIREPELCRELQGQKWIEQALQMETDPSFNGSAPNNEGLSTQAQIFFNFYVALDILFSHADLKQELELIRDKHTQSKLLN